MCFSAEDPLLFADRVVHASQARAAAKVKMVFDSILLHSLFSVSLKVSEKESAIVEFYFEFVKSFCCVKKIFEEQS